jgi:aminopeptidase N
VHDRIVLNSYNLVIHEATIEGTILGSHPFKAKGIVHDRRQRIVTLEFGEAIRHSNRQSRLSIRFHGVLSNTLNGFYRSAYSIESGEKAYMFSTKCEV